MTYTWPVDMGVYGINQEFGSNPNNGINPAGGHTGRDIGTPTGTPVHAIGAGVVKFADWSNTLPADYRADGSGPNPYWLAPNFGGIVVAIDHGDIISIYAHLSKTDLAVGQQVAAGEVIGLSGSTGGASSGPHLHFEILPSGWDFNNGCYGRVSPSLYCSGAPVEVAAQANTVTPIQEDDMPTLAEIFDNPIAREGSALGGTTTLRAIVANFDAAQEGTKAAIEGIWNALASDPTDPSKQYRAIDYLVSAATRGRTNGEALDALRKTPAAAVNIDAQAIANQVIASVPAAVLDALKTQLSK